MGARRLGRAAGIVLLALAGAGQFARAGEREPLALGSDAPPIDVAAWVNVPEGHEPTPASLKGKVVMIEFWETGCGPCVRSMPRVQEFHEKYGTRGLVVLAVSWEAAVVISAYAKDHGLTFPMGCDPSKACLHAYQVGGFPTTYVIDREGKVAYVGEPSEAEGAIEKALGLETGPGALLSAYTKALAAKDAATVRPSLERLSEKATSGFDLRAWALGAGGAAPAPDKPVAKADGAKTLSDYAKACVAGAADRQKASLDLLAAGGPASFDLGAWARDAFGRDFPVTSKEFQQFLSDTHFDAAIDALVDRRPAGAVLDAAAKSAPLAVYCSKHAAEARLAGRKGIMVLHWPIANRLPKDEKKNQEFWQEIAANGMATTADRKSVVGVSVGGVMLTEPMLGAFIDRQFARGLVMEAVAAGKKPNLGKLADEVSKAKAATLKELEVKYGE